MQHFRKSFIYTVYLQFINKINIYHIIQYFLIDYIFVWRNNVQAIFWQSMNNGPHE